MNYKDTINTILDTASKHIYVNEVGSGDVYEFLNSGEHIYPIVFLTVDNVTKDITNINDNYTLNGYLYYIDRLTKDDSNKCMVYGLRNGDGESTEYRFTCSEGCEIISITGYRE